MTQMLETWKSHTNYLIFLKSYHRNIANHHQSLYVIRLLIQLNAT